MRGRCRLRPLSRGQAIAQWPTDIRIDKGGDGFYKSHTYVARAGSNVYVCWEDERSGVPNVYFSMSDSYGATGTWTTPAGVDPVGGQYHKQEYPVMAITGKRVYLAWQDNRDTDLNVYMNHSKDGGKTWDPNDVRRVDTDTPWGGDSLYIVIAATTVETGGGNLNGVSPGGGVSYKLHGASGETGATWKKPPQSRDLVYCFWRDYRNSQGSFMLDVYFNYSHDGGLTWGNPDQRMNTDHSTPGTFWVGEPAIAASEKGVYVVWLDEKDDVNPGSDPYIDDVYINISHTGGLPGNWSGPRRMDQGTSPGTVDSWNPKVAASGPTPGSPGWTSATTRSTSTTASTFPTPRTTAGPSRRPSGSTATQL